MKVLSVRDTNALKGVALLLLLLHHCLYTGDGYDDIIIFGHPLYQNIGRFSKICVALFIFLSGYGLTAKTMKNKGIDNIWGFYRQRYMKLMINFWVIYLLFVPIGIFFFHRTFPFVYGDNYLLKGLVDFFGLYKCVFNDFHGYNATWWFMGVIIIMYLLYPLLWKYRHFWFVMIPLAVMCPTVASFIPIFGPSDFGHYFLAFVCGIAFAYKMPCLDGVNLLEKIFLFLAFLLSCFFRFYAWNMFLWDAGIITIGLVLYNVVNIPFQISSILVFLGKHSYNIFLFHTFIYFYFFHDYIFWSRNPLLICGTLLLVCIPISLGIEWVKERLKINSITLNL